MTRSLKQTLDDAAHPMGTWLSIGHPTVAEVSASQDLEFVLIDTEHTSISLETVENMARGVDAAGSTDCLVRVPWNDHVRLKRVLDIGVDGVMVPMIDDGADAEALVEAMRYPPEGNRGIAAGRASGYGDYFSEYVTSVNGSIFTIAQIETRTGLENAEEIAAVEGIDALFVGPADLSAALGIFGEWDSETFTDAMQRVLDAGAAADVPVGTLTVDVDDVETRIQQGFDFLIVGKDTSYLTQANQEAREVYDEAVEEKRSTDVKP